MDNKAAALRTLARRTAVAALLASGVLLSGCYDRHHPGYDSDRHHHHHGDHHDGDHHYY